MCGVFACSKEKNRNQLWQNNAKNNQDKRIDCKQYPCFDQCVGERFAAGHRGVFGKSASRCGADCARDEKYCRGRDRYAKQDQRYNPRRERRVARADREHAETVAEIDRPQCGQRGELPFECGQICKRRADYPKCEAFEKSSGRGIFAQFERLEQIERGIVLYLDCDRDAYCRADGKAYGSYQQRPRIRRNQVARAIGCVSHVKFEFHTNNLCSSGGDMRNFDKIRYACRRRVTWRGMNEELP